MKLTIQWNKNFRSEQLVALKEVISTIGNSFGTNQNWLEDLAIFMGYNFDPLHPSVRICRLQLRKPLRDLGVKADIIFRYEDVEPYKNILLSHFDDELAAMCEIWRRQGKRIYFSHTEDLWGLPEQAKVFNLCDYIVCCSNKLVELTQPRLESDFTKCWFIPDMAEEPTSEQPIMHTPQNIKPLKCVYVGMGGNSYMAHNLRPLIEELGMSLTVISEWSNAVISWDRNTYLDIMAQHDIAICPQNVEQQPAKSHIKVITAMSRGLPVICSPNPAYLEIVDHGINGFIANTIEEWRDALGKLKNFELRKRMSQAALNTSLNFTPHAIALHWLSLLTEPQVSIAFANNTLRQKYLSYGDAIVEDLRFNAYSVEEYRYEDIDRLPKGFDYYVFVEDRFNAEDIADVHPRILLTKEEQNLNTIPHFDVIICFNEQEAERLNKRGFVNVFYQSTFDMKQIQKLAKLDLVEKRKQHNKNLHSNHIDAFHHLQQPEDRWEHGLRDIEHIKFSMMHSKPSDDVLDIGSADGFLSLFLAKEKRNVSAMDFVRRGMEWTEQHAERLGVEIDLRYGFIEEVEEVFNDKFFDAIMVYEILEHLDYLKLPWYLSKLEALLKPNGKILISLPKQDLHENPEHLFTPSAKLIKKVFSKKKDYELTWVPIENHSVPGNWFISYNK